MDEEKIEIDSPDIHWKDSIMGESGEHEVIMEEGEISEGSISNESEASMADCTSRIRLIKPLKDIWTTDEILSSLQKLSGGEEVASLTSIGKTEVLTRLPGGVLWACWLGRPVLLQKILLTGASPHITDEAGRTGLHLAAMVGNAECLSILIQRGTKVNQWDAEQCVTPLHCAASAKSLSCVQMLLNHGADVNAGISQRSPLHYAVQSNATECVQELLKRGACPDTPQVYTETPLHVAATRGLVECARLLLKHGADARAQMGKSRSTALHLAAEEGHTDCARVLIEAGAFVDATNSKLQTPLHLASVAQAADTLELLIRMGASTRARDADGRTPLHGALGRASRCGDCVRLLLAARADVNQPDQFGYTPMHLAALNEFSGCVSLLLDNGGDVTLRTKGGHSVLSFIVRRTPEVIPKYIEKFDDAIKVTDHEIGDVDCELKMDFRPLVPAVGRQEVALLLTFIEVGRRDVLKHPLCETFLFLKWRRIRKFFLSSLIFHAVFVLIYSVYIIGLYLRDCLYVDNKIKYPCDVPTQIKIIGYFLLCLDLLFLGKEIFQMCHDFIGYVKRWENWLQWLIILSVFLCALPGMEELVQPHQASWHHHVAAISIFIVWLELMIIIGRFPMFGLYVQMFKTVAVNFSKFLMAYSCLLIAFGLSFGVLFAEYNAFGTIWLSLIKTVIMMAGELEYEDIFYNNALTAPILYPGTTHVFFLTFVILVTVILTNLLVGLAVSDIQALLECAGLDRLVRQAELVARLESMLFSPLLHWVPPRVLAMLHKAALLLASRYRWALCIRPNDPRENRVPKDLIASIYKLVASRKEHPKNFKNSKKPDIAMQNNRLSALYDTNNTKPNVKKSSSILRPRTTSDVSTVIYRRTPSSTSSPNFVYDNDVKSILNRINDIATKLDKLQNIVEDKFSTLDSSTDNVQIKR